MSTNTSTSTEQGNQQSISTPIGINQQLIDLGKEFRCAYGTLGNHKNQLKALHKQSLAEAFNCGEILSKAKAIAIGGWGKWVEEHAQTGYKTCERLIKLHENRKQLQELNATTLTE